MFVYLALSQHTRCTAYALDQTINLLAGIVERKRRATHTRHTEMFHYGLGAVLSRADRNAQLVENHTHVVVMCALDVERADRALSLRLTIDSQSVNRAE